MPARRWGLARVLGSRVLSALVLGPVMLLLVWLGGWPFTLLVAALAAVGGAEGTELLRKGGVTPPAGLGVAGAAGAVLLAGWGGVPGLLGAVAAGTAASLLWPVFRPGPGRAMAGLAAMLPLAFAGWLPAHLVLLRDLGPGRGWTLVLVLSVWAFDTAGYFVGRGVGGPRLSPQISPNKTLSGFLGGVLAASGMAGLTAPWLAGQGALAGLLLGAAAGVWAQAGDLAESAWKRWAGVKDAGRIIPGHGGVLDRFDALFFVAPLAYWVARWLG